MANEWNREEGMSESRVGSDRKRAASAIRSCDREEW